MAFTLPALRATGEIADYTICAARSWYDKYFVSTKGAFAQMNRFKGVLPYFCVLLLDFYALPLLMRDTGSGMFLLLAAMPAICLAASAAFGVRNGLRLWYAPAVALLFAPSVPLFYNDTAWVYVPAFGVLALLGNLAALPFRKR